jgi:hypothetical protein
LVLTSVASSDKLHLYVGDKNWSFIPIVLKPDGAKVVNEKIPANLCIHEN